MAQLGSALHWGCRGRGFKSRRSDHFFRRATARSVGAVNFFGPPRAPHPVFVDVPGVPRRTEIPALVAKFTVSPENIEDIIALVKTLEGK